jgi:transposase
MSATIVLRATRRHPQCGVHILQTAKKKHPERHHAKFCGTLQADAHAGINHFYESGFIQESGCWAHLRRKFYDLQQAHTSPVAIDALQGIAALYTIEKEIRGRPCQ